MGNCSEKITSMFKKKNGNSQIGKISNCPKCNHQFPSTTTYNSFNHHVDSCIQHHTDFHQILAATLQIQQQHQIQQQQQQQQVHQKSYNIWQKIPDVDKPNYYKWIKVVEETYANSQIRSKSLEQIKNVGFQEKHAWFRLNVEKLRIPWEQGADWVTIYQDNVLLTSIKEIKKCNLHKEVKIKIDGDEVQDAGGLLREWIHLIVKEAFHPNTGMFTMAETEDVSYKINPHAMEDPHILDCFALVGKIIGKAIFERIPFNLYLDHSIIKYIIKQEVTLEDIQYYDKDFYKSWKFMLENDIDEEDFNQNFVVYLNSMFNDLKIVELVPNGQEVIVNNDNKQQYVDLCVEFYTKKCVKPFLDAMVNEIYKVIPADLLSIFKVHEFEMIFNSVPKIDITDWKQNTIYKDCNKDTQSVKWFWQVLSELDEPKLADFLKYCTGSQRTPIHGFKKLETNRGNFSKFQIISIPLNKKNPFPKAYTCFNRLELPQYSSISHLKQYIYAIVTNDLDGIFGME